MELIVAEKPKVANTIARALGGPSVKRKLYNNIGYYYSATEKYEKSIII